MIAFGRVYDFEGLIGETPDPDDARRILTVVGISVTGNVQFQMRIEDPDPGETNLSGETIIGIPLTETLAMIEHSVLVERP